MASVGFVNLVEALGREAGAQAEAGHMAHRLGEYFEVAEQAELIQHQQQRMAMRRDRRGHS